MNKLNVFVLFFLFFLFLGLWLQIEAYAQSLDVTEVTEDFPNGSVTLDNGKKIDRGMANFDVDGDNISEAMNVKIDNSARDAFVKAQAFVKSELNDGLLKAVAQALGKGGTVKSFSGGSLNHIVVMANPAGLVALSYLPFIDVISPADDLYNLTAMAREYTGINYAATQAQNLSKPNGLFDSLSPINGDHDGNVSSYSVNDVVVAVIDTGIDPSHAAFANGKIIGWKDVTGECSSPCDPYVPVGPVGHGTAVASIAVGADRVSGNFGVAPGAALVGVKVRGATGVIEYQSLVSALKWVYDNRSVYNIKVVNISIGSNDYCYSGGNWSAANAAIHDLYSMGIAVVVAIGNGSLGQSQSCLFNEFAARGESISVGALADPSISNKFADGYDPSRMYGWTVAPWSSMGPTSDGAVRPTISAPGVDVVAAVSGTSNTYAAFTGTSAAAPFVAGVAAALLDGMNFTLSPNQIAWYMQSTADFSGGLSYWGNSKYGSGYIRPFDAYKAAIGSSSTWDDGYAHSYVNEMCSNPGSTLDFQFYSFSASSVVSATLVAKNFQFGSNNKQAVWLIAPSGSIKWDVSWANQGLGQAWSTFNAYDPTPEVGWYHLYVKNNSLSTFCDYLSVSTHN